MMNKAVFLDRDGVINERIKDGYVTDWKEFQFLSGVKKAIESLKKEGFLVIIVTNQRGIAKGLMTEEDLREIHRRMQEKLGKGNIDAIYFCPHNEDEGCECRKPKPGMFLKAAQRFRIDFKRSYIIGDSESDMEAGETLGLKRIFVGRDDDYHGLEDRDIHFVPDLATAAGIIIDNKEGR
jgi:D-glycero-D-manno-heptose 1,7-bisphosphate phosphatase